MDNKQLLLRLFQVVSGSIRHKHYKHTVAKNKRYMQLVAGVGTDELLKKFVRRETEELFEQRVNLTRHIVTSVCKQLIDVYYKVPRSNSARRLITYTSETDKTTKVEDVEGILSKFWGTESWDDYMATRLIELTSTDPNSFVVFEWDDFDNRTQLIQPRPYEVPSKAAIDLKYVNRVLQYLIVKDEHIYKEATISSNIAPIGENVLDPMYGKKKGSKYTLYGMNQTFQLRQIAEQTIRSVTAPIEGTVVKTTLDGRPAEIVRLGSEFFELITLKAHNCGDVPAFRVGFLRDPETTGETYVNQIHAAQPYIEKTIKVNSELDLVATLLAMPQQIAYSEPCPDDTCYNGYQDSGAACGTCGGTGLKPTAPSSQDAIRIKMPDSKEEMLPLKDIITYVHPPVDIVQWQENYIDKLTDKAKQIMFNSDIFTKSQISDTATGKNLDMQNVYDTLYPFATKFAKDWGFGVTIMAKLADRGKDLLALYSFGKDFKLKTLDSLIADLAAADALSSSILTEHLDQDIAQIIFAEKPIELQRYNLQRLVDPFSGKTETQILYLLASPYVTKQDKVLHANFSRIFDTLEMEFGSSKKNFYKIPRAEQREAIYAEVDKIISEIGQDAPDLSVATGTE